MPSLLLLMGLTKRLSVDTHWRALCAYLYSQGHSLSGQGYAQDSYYPVSASVSSVMITQGILEFGCFSKKTIL